MAARTVVGFPSRDAYSRTIAVVGEVERTRTPLGSRKRPSYGTPATPARLGRAVAEIAKGDFGMIRRLEGDTKGTEVPVGEPFLVYSRFGTVKAEADVAYVDDLNGTGPEVLQSWC